MANDIQGNGPLQPRPFQTKASVAGAAPSAPGGKPAGMSGDSAALSNPVALAAARMKASVPPGVDMKVTGDRIEFSRAGSGEPLYSASFKDGQWSHGGYRQHGIFGPPERPGIMKALEAGGIVQPKPPEQPQPVNPGTKPEKPQVPTPTQAGYERIARMLGGQLPGIDVKATANGIAFSRNGEGFYELSVRDGQWSSGGYRQHGLRGHPDTPAVREVLRQNGYSD